MRKIGLIDSFKGKWEILEKEKDQQLHELKKITTIKSIGSSTRIEGATLSNEEVATIIEKLHINKLEKRDEQEVVGYYETLEVILESYKEIELKESHIYSLHNLLLKFSTKDQSHKGQYKKISNKVVATYPGGVQKTIFNTTEPFLVKKEMEYLFQWANNEFSKEEIHPLMITAVFVYEFLTIHPFQDGNGRLSRLLTTLLLLKNNYLFIQYISFENQIEQKKKEYYQALMAAQQHRNTEQEVIDKWVLFFLECLEVMTRKLEVKYESFKNEEDYMSPRQKQLIQHIRKSGPLKVGDLSNLFDDITIHTIKKDLQYLGEKEFIKKSGKGKGTYYTFNHLRKEH